MLKGRLIPTPGKRRRLAESLIYDEVFVLDEEIVADTPRRRERKRRLREKKEKNASNAPDSEMETETDMEVTEVKDNVNTEMGLRPERGATDPRQRSLYASVRRSTSSSVVLRLSTSCEVRRSTSGYVAICRIVRRGPL